MDKLLFLYLYLGFWKSVNLLAVGVRMAEMNHRAKFRRNGSIRYRDIAIFRFFRWQLSAILDLFRAYLVFYITLQHVVAIDLVVSII